MRDEVFERVVQFMLTNGISCVESVSQTDHVIENAYEFIEDLYEIVESELPKEDDIIDAN